ncbi:TraR/DksA C4-type zinc finger protein [Nocardioides sp. C4-1]|uniref:TraR/DksA family transcriptional regulator n=1 Tax=Nocardioides sp. C4-1 TaxID=3151851 RepID=UPI0032675583
MTDTRSTALPAHLHDELVRAARRRTDQLAALPPFEGDLVAEAHRASVARILEEISAALARWEDGTYGRCTGCGRPIPVERLELRVWAAHCVRCAAPAR